MLKGIDISHHQRGMDLSKVNFDFVIIKATEGVGYVDECCDGFFQQALKLGKKIGFYHFARPVNDAVKEAQFFYENTKNYFGKRIPVLDWEMENKWNVAWAKAWLDEVYRLSGVKPIIYMSLSVMNGYDWTPVANGNYGLWVASYGKNPICRNYDNAWAVKPAVEWWSFMRMWQWGSQCRLNGWSGNLDVNEFYGDEAAWDRYAGAKEESQIPARLVIGYASEGDIKTITKLLDAQGGITYEVNDGFVYTSMVSKGDQKQIVTKCEELGIPCKEYVEVLVNSEATKDYAEDTETPVNPAGEDFTDKEKNIIIRIIRFLIKLIGGLE